MEATSAFLNRRAFVCSEEKIGAFISLCTKVMGGWIHIHKVSLASLYPPANFLWTRISRASRPAIPRLLCVKYLWLLSAFRHYCLL